MGLLCLSWRSQRRFETSVSVCPDDTFWITEHFVTKFGMMMQHREPELCGHFCCCCYFQGQGHNKSSYDQNMALSSIISELLIPRQHQSVRWKKKERGLLHSGSRSQRRVRMLMFVQIISSIPSKILFSNLVLWFIIMSQSVMQKDWFAFFKVKVTARAHTIKVWPFLLYLLNCWSFCYQTWFDSTLS